MSLVNIVGVIRDPAGAFPAFGELRFLLDGPFVSATGSLVEPMRMVVLVNPIDGTFNIDLESTTDGTPNSRVYDVWLRSGIYVKLGSFALDPPTLSPPPSQQLTTLLGGSISWLS